jgi:hypothetical protein
VGRGPRPWVKPLDPWVAVLDPWVKLLDPWVAVPDPALIADLERMVRFHLRRAQEKGVAEAFALLPKSPKTFWERYQSGSGERLEVVIHAEPAAVPGADL